MGNHRPRLDYYTFFTKYSLMEDYGFLSGLSRRLFRKFLPLVPPRGTVDHFLLENECSVDKTLAAIAQDREEPHSMIDDLDQSIKALSAKIVAFGLDSDIQDKCQYLEIATDDFAVLLKEVNDITTGGSEDIKEIRQALAGIKAAVTSLRLQKKLIGTSLHLTLVTVRILEYVAQVELLLSLKQNLASDELWRAMLDRRLKYTSERSSLRTYIRRHTDLLAIEVVEHTSDKGEKYIAENKKEYHGFLRRSLLGGAIISVFALGKMAIDAQELTTLSSALCFSLNYAACFVLVKQFGGLIATKQPAMTASTIAKYADRSGDFALGPAADIVLLIRRVFRSQFISLVGNFSMALLFACLIAFVFGLVDLGARTDIIDPDYLIKNVMPSGRLVFFAAVAGVFLALSGLISGYFDNQVLSSRIAVRVEHSRLFFKSSALARYIEEKGGVLIGNVSLGFFLGCAFLLSYVLPFYFDIRHIAFSSANVGYAMVVQGFALSKILWAVAGVLIIGAVNFLVSFSITLALALKSRGATVRVLPKLIGSVAKDFVRRPLCYFVFPADETERAE